jgi:hypothetical protein
MRRLTLLICCAFILVGCVACEPTPPPSYPAQRPGTIHFEGDSVTWNTYYGTGVAYPGTSGEWAPGNRIDLSPWGGAGMATIDRLPKELSAGKVDKLVWGLGLNEIGSQHEWTVKHQLMWYDMLINHVPEETCIVMVLPWVLPVDWANRPLQEIMDLRVWIQNLAMDHSNIVLVDWRPILEANPGYSPEDGVHIKPGTGGPEARDAMYREGLARCG